MNHISIKLLLKNKNTSGWGMVSNFSQQAVIAIIYYRWNHTCFSLGILTVFGLRKQLQTYLGKGTNTPQHIRAQCIYVPSIAPTMYLQLTHEHCRPQKQTQWTWCRIEQARFLGETFLSQVLHMWRPAHHHSHQAKVW